MSAASSQASAVSTSVSSAPVCASCGNAKPTLGAGMCCDGTGPTRSAARTWQPLISPTLMGEGHDGSPTGDRGFPIVWTSSAEDSPAKTSASPASEQDSEAPAPPSSSSSHESLSLFAPAGFSSRTYPDFFPPTVDGISPSYSATLAELGYGVCWRVLDSRFFGVPQRRRRVFIVGHLGAGSAAPFLPFLEGGEGHPAESGEARPRVAGSLTTGSGGGRYDKQPLHYYVEDFEDGTLTSSHGRIDRHPLITDSGTQRVSHEGDAPFAMAGAGVPESVIAAPLSHGSNPNSNAAGRRREDDENLVTGFHMLQDPISEEDSAPAWGKGNKTGTASIGVATGSAVRRLTPTECCRLQGFPADWLGPENEPPDSPRYAALGDAVTVNVAEWIGRRILEAEAVIA